MQFLLAPFRFIYKIYFAIIFAVSVILFAPFFFIAVSFKKGFEYGFTWRRIWSKFLEIFWLVPLLVKGRSNFPKQGPYIIVANHASYLDIVLMYGVVPHRFRFLGKAEILKWPVLNHVFKKMDIAVDRSSKTKAYQSLELCGKALDAGDCIVIFPEGGWNAKKRGLQRFKNGAFKLAIERNIPIVPISFVRNRELFCDQTDLFFNGRPGIALTIVHPTVDTKDLSANDLVSLRRQTYQTINSVLPDDY